MRELMHKWSIIPIFFSPFSSQLSLALIIIHKNMTFTDTNRYVNKDAPFVNKIARRSHIIVKRGIREKILL